MSDNSATQPKRRRPLQLITGLAVILITAAGAFAFWFLRDDSPEEVSIGEAAEELSTETTKTTDEPVATNSPATTSATSTAESTTLADSDGITGEWSVDTSIGEFSYEESTGTFVGFRIEEELSSIGSTTAVGRTPSVTGTLIADATTISEVTIEADMTAITTNESRRDDNVQDALETDQFPTATFTLTEPIELPEGALNGEPVSVEASGDLTIHGVTMPVTIPLNAQLVDETIVVVGSLDITFADYGVEIPSAPIVVSVDDHGPLELKLFFTR